MGKLENKVERYLHDSFVKRGGYTYKFVSPGHANVPDRICMVKGLIFFVEVKTFDKEATEAQIRELERLAGFGCATISLSGASEVNKFMKFVDSILEACDVSALEEARELMNEVLH